MAYNVEYLLIELQYPIHTGYFDDFTTIYSVANFRIYFQAWT